MVMRLLIYSIRMQGQRKLWNYSIELNMECTVDPTTHFDSAQCKPIGAMFKFVANFQGTRQVQVPLRD